MGILKKGEAQTAKIFVLQLIIKMLIENCKS